MVGAGLPNSRILEDQANREAGDRGMGAVVAEVEAGAMGHPDKDFGVWTMSGDSNIVSLEAFN